MARVEIRLPEERREAVEQGRMVAARYYEVLVDGRSIDGLTGVTVAWDLEGIPTATLEMNVEHLDIDALALANLKLHIMAPDEPPANPGP